MIIVSATIKAQNGRSMEYFLRAEQAKLNNEPDSALLYYRKAFEQDSLSLTILMNLGDLYSELGDNFQSENYYKQIVDAYNFQLEAGRKLFEIYQKEDKNQEALNLMDSLLYYHPESIDLYYNLAGLYYKTADWDNLLETYKLIYKLNPENSELLNNLFRLGLDLGKKDKVYEIIQEILSGNAEDENALVTLARLRFLDQEIEAGLALLNHAYSIGNDQNILLQMIEISLRSDRIEPANKYLSNYFKSHGKDFNSLQLLCETYVYYDHFDSIFSMSKQLIELDKLHSYGYERLIYSGIELEEFTEMEEIFLGSISEFPDETLFKFMLGGVYYSWDKKDDAFTWYYKSLQREPENLEMKRLVAGISEEIKNYELSDSLYLNLLEMDSTDASDMNNYAYSLCERPSADMDYALELAQRAVNIEPENPAFLDTIGWIYFKLDYFEEALISLEKSIKLDSLDTVILEHLGDVYRKTGNISRAEYIYRRILALNPNSDIIPEKLNQLKNNE